MANSSQRDEERGPDRAQVGGRGQRPQGEALRAKLLGGEYIWCWDTRVLDGGDSGRTKAQFEQSSFFEFPISAGRLQKWAADHVPKLNQEGEVDEFIVER